MFKYFQTTTLILLWCLLISLLWSFAVYYWESRRKSAPKEGVPGKVLLPALVLAPACLTLGFRFFGLNLLFPLHFFASLPRIAAAALVPALVLLLASGLMGNIARSIRFEYAHWSQKVFATVAKSLGGSIPSSIKRLVLLKAISQAWSQSLPWMFGELIVVEAIFNAPGLGLDAWHLAQVRDASGLTQAILWLVGLYGFCVFLTALISNWIGKKLEGYA